MKVIKFSVQLFFFKFIRHFLKFHKMENVQVFFYYITIKLPKIWKKIIKHTT